jgi:hypothetical protein
VAGVPCSYQRYGGLLFSWKRSNRRVVPGARIVRLKQAPSPSGATLVGVS